MKKIILSAFAALALLFANNSMAQISHGGEPLFNKSLSKAVVPEMSMPAIDNEQYLSEDLNSTKGASPLRVAVMQEKTISVTDEAKIVKDAAGTHYLMAVSSPGATFVQLYFSKYDIPEGAELYFYDQSGDFTLGSFNAGDIKADGSFYTQAIPGSIAYIEYNVPEGKNPGNLVISNVYHGYKDLFQSIANDYEAVEMSLKGAHGQAEGNCHINVVCSEGDDWRDQIRSVVAIEIMAGGYSYMCSGALINNANQDKKPYVLSAYHCQDVEGTLQGFVSYFLYQTTSCNGTIGPGNKSVTGATIKAKNSFNGGSDFLLLLLNQNVPDSYKPYYAGWERSSIASPAPGACIHHPGGDYKKISIPKTITKGTGSYSKFYTVAWYTGSQNKGVTEQGSSGSPLFNSDKRIIGQLYAGSSACDYMSGTDLYGRVYSSWTGDGTNNGSLKPWLDPNNTNISTLDGIDYQSSNVDIVSPEDAINNSAACDLTVYPNPSNGVIHFDVDALGDANYKLFDLNGRCVKEGRTILTSTSQAIDLGQQSKGSYILQLFTASRCYTASVIIK